MEPDRFKGPAPERQWLVEHTIPMASVFVLAAMGDAGKGLLTLDLALGVAGKQPTAPEWSWEDYNPYLTALGNGAARNGLAQYFLR